MSDFKAKMYQIRFRLGPPLGSLQRFPDPLTEFKGAASRQGRGRERDGEREGRGMRREGKRRGGGKGEKGKGWRREGGKVTKGMGGMGGTEQVMG